MDEHGNTPESPLRKMRQWLADLRRIGDFDERQAHAALAAVLHTMRDRLPIEHGARIGGELPILIRGLYYDGWKPDLTAELGRSPQEFRDAVQKRLADPPIAAERALRAVFALLNERIDAGELTDIRAALPADVQKVWGDSASFE